MENNINSLFEKNSNWDFETLNKGHENRFLAKLELQKKKKKKKTWLPITIAAAFLLSFGILYFSEFSTEAEVQFSPQVQETHDYFSSVINSELKSLQKQENPETAILINDALKEMETLEKDYESLKKEIVKNGENKQIVFAMITNMQTRISFIKTVLEQVEQINNFKNKTNEKYI
uniref:anti-sigma factor n=1 Tax=Flavobacterium sp. TaxID=239 RepID=UPI00404B07C0